MKSPSPFWVTLALLLAPVLVAPAARAASPQESSATSEEPPQPQLLAPESAEAAVKIEPSNLAKAVEAASDESLEPFLAAWMRLVEEQQAALEALLLLDENSDERQAEVRVRSDREALLARAEVVVRELASRHVDVATQRARLLDLRDLDAQQQETDAAAPPNIAQAMKLDVEVLRAQLRPLTRDQVAEQLALWMKLLQSKCHEVRNVEIAALQSENVDEIEKFNERAVAVRGERALLIQRVNVVIASLKAKGGDVEEARAYVNSVVVKPPITGWRAVLTTSKAWALDDQGGIALGVRLAKALAILIGFWILSRIFGRLSTRALRSFKKASALLKEFIASSISRLTLIVGVLVALGTLGVNMTPLLAAIGAAGLVIGLALQGTLSNFASGIMIMFYRPFDVGDAVSTGGVKGTVQGMTLVTTTIATFDNQAVHVPNNMVWNNVITNITAKATRRVDLIFGIGYDDDVRKAKQVLQEVVKDNALVLDDPAPVIEVGELGESSVNFIVRPWTKTSDYWKVYWGLTQAVKERFDAEGISIPFPQRDVHHYATSGGDVILQPAAREDSVQPGALEKSQG